MFLIIVIQLYVDRLCHADLKASAQNLFAFITMGIAMPVGMYIGGEMLEMLTNPETHTVNYQLFFMIPAAAILILLVVFYKFVTIKDPNRSNGSEKADGELPSEGTQPA